MRIGIDIHGVIDKDLAYFKNLMLEYRSSRNGQKNNIIYIISGPPIGVIIKELVQFGLVKDKHYDGILSVVDYLKSCNVEMWLDFKNTWWASDEDWWSTKGKLCEKYKIDIMIDDQIRYAQYMPETTRFVLYKIPPPPPTPPPTRIIKEDIF